MLADEEDDLLEFEMLFEGATVLVLCAEDVLVVASEGVTATEDLVHPQMKTIIARERQMANSFLNIKPIPFYSNLLIFIRIPQTSKNIK